MNERQVTLARRGLTMVVIETKTGEYLKDVEFYTGDVADGTYRIVRHANGRFQFRRLVRNYWNGLVYTGLVDYKMGRAVSKRGGRGWRARGVRLYRLSRHVRFDLVPV